MFQISKNDYPTAMEVPVVDFSRERSKIRDFRLKNNCSQMKSLNFENWSSGQLSKIGHHLKKIKYLQNSMISFDYS